jgi:cobalamin biosynthesis protein CobT
MGETARAIFEGVEQARVEALGTRRMAGVATNLSAMLEERYRRQGYEHMTERNETTLIEAIRLLAREALTQMPPPQSAKKSTPSSPNSWRGTSTTIAPETTGACGRGLMSCKSGRKSDEE